MTFPGGKEGAGVYQTIISLMPPHSVYVEPFLGGGAIMRWKKPAKKTIGIDLDASVRRAMRDHFAKKSEYGSVTILCDDGIRWLAEFGPQLPLDALCYIDPPYLLSVRKSGPLYRCELTRDQHIELLEILKGLHCQVMLSGYWSELYHEMLVETEIPWYQFCYKA